MDFVCYLYNPIQGNCFTSQNRSFLIYETEHASDTCLTKTQHWLDELLTTS